ncbi:MAG TPA: hypothetical protein VFD66_07365 [Verrucomicrobiae bacterium]|nr:hypothetical protein [Verrucomicrobiae bacterium]
MTLSGKIQIGLLTAGIFLIGLQFQRHHRQAGESSVIENEVRSKARELESRQAVLAALEKRNGELLESERRAGNENLLSLMRERAAATSAAQDSSGIHSLGSALATVLDSPEQQEIDRENLRNDMKANLRLFFKLVNLSPEKIEQFIDLNLEMERRKANRMSALLRGNMTVADALAERDRDNLESDDRKRAVLGAEGCAFRESIAEGMRNDEAKRLLNIIQQNMGGNTLSQDQSSRLQGLLKTEIVGIPLDDTDLFRPPDEWAQIVAERQQNVLSGAAAFLSESQMETLKALTAVDLAQRRQEMVLKRKALGIRSP